MKYSPHQGFSLHSTLISAQHENVAKRQMKESKTSERKNTQMSLIFHLFFLCLILSMTSCFEKSDYHFKNPADALEQYRDFHHSIASVPQTKAEQLAISSVSGRNSLIPFTTISRKILLSLPMLLCP